MASKCCHGCSSLSSSVVDSFERQSVAVRLEYSEMTSLYRSLSSAYSLYVTASAVVTSPLCMECHVFVLGLQVRIRQ